MEFLYNFYREILDLDLHDAGLLTNSPKFPAYIFQIQGCS